MIKNLAIKILAILQEFPNLQKKFFEPHYTKEKTSKAATSEFLTKFLKERKYLKKMLTFLRGKYL